MSKIRITRDLSLVPDHRGAIIEFLSGDNIGTDLFAVGITFPSLQACRNRSNTFFVAKRPRKEK